jgi:hypothetical protein
MANQSFVIYDGPSLIDGKPIVAIAQVNTGNRKTGNMAQTWILRSDIDPITASRTLMFISTLIASVSYGVWQDWWWAVLFCIAACLYLVKTHNSDEVLT